MQPRLIEVRAAAGELIHRAEIGGQEQEPAVADRRAQRLGVPACVDDEEGTLVMLQRGRRNGPGEAERLLCAGDDLVGLGQVLLPRPPATRAENLVEDRLQLVGDPEVAECRPEPL